jgi:hypothetical protein
VSAGGDNGAVFFVLEKNGLIEAISGLGDGDASPVTRADLEAAMQAAPVTPPDLTDPAEQWRLYEAIREAYWAGRTAEPEPEVEL